MKRRLRRFRWWMGVLLGMLLILFGLWVTDAGSRMWLRWQVGRACPSHTYFFALSEKVWGGVLLWFDSREVIYANEGGLFTRRWPRGWPRKLLARGQITSSSLLHDPLLAVTPEGRWLAVESATGAPRLPAGGFDPTTHVWLPAWGGPPREHGVWLLGPKRTARLLPLSAPSIQGLALSPDGRQVAWSSLRLPRGGPSEPGPLQLLDLTSGATRPVVASESGTQPAFSPDGQRLAYWNDFSGILAVYDLRPGQAISWCGVSSDFIGSRPPLVWRPDGRALRCVTEDGVVEATPNRERWLWLFREGNLAEAANRRQVLSPNGRWVAYEKDQAIWLVDLDTRRRCRLAGGETPPSGRVLKATYPVWRADGKAVAFQRWTEGLDPLRWHQGRFGTYLGWWAAPVPERLPPERPAERVTLPEKPLTVFEALVSASDQTDGQWALTHGFIPSDTAQPTPLKQVPLAQALAAIARAHGYTLRRIGMDRYWLDREPTEGYFARGGGFLRMSVRVYGEPAEGLVEVGISRPALWTSWRHIRVTLDRDGTALLGPLEPGTYRVTLSYRTWRNQSLPQANTFHPRPGVPGKQDPPAQTWLNEVKYVEVQPGQTTECSPLRLVSTVKTTQPLHEDVVEAHVPTFAWEPFPGAARYRVRLSVLIQANYHTFWVSDPVVTTRLTYAPERGQIPKDLEEVLSSWQRKLRRGGKGSPLPESGEASLSLRPGRTYSWSVDALDVAGNLVSRGSGGDFRLRR